MREFDEYSKTTEATRAKFLEQIRKRLDSYWVIEESILGGFLIGCSENIYVKAHAHGENIIVHRVRTTQDVLTAPVEESVEFIVTFLESREDELRDMETAPVNGKPFLVVIQRGSGERLFRVGYFYPNARLVGDCFDFDRKCLGWIPIPGIKYD